MPNIKLQSSDGEIFDVEMEIVNMSKTLKTMFEDLGSNDDEIVSLRKIRSDILKKVLEWAHQHRNDPLPTETDDDEKMNEFPLPSDDIDDWDAEFMNVCHATRFELINAANFLNIKGLLDLACKAVANTIKGKSVEEIREVFHIDKSSNIDSDIDR